MTDFHRGEPHGGGFHGGRAALRPIWMLPLALFVIIAGLWHVILDPLSWITLEGRAAGRERNPGERVLRDMIIKSRLKTYFIFTVLDILPEERQEMLSSFRTLAKNGDVDLQTKLGYMYSYGNGVPKDEEEAIRWFRTAAAHGSEVGQNALGFRYNNGRGVQKDVREAARWYRLSAENGLSAGQYNLGLSYLRGVGVPVDRDQALRWFTRAAKQKHPGSQRAVGYVFRSRWDLVMTYGFWKMEVDSGDGIEARDLASLEKLLTRDQKEEGLRRAKAWLDSAADQGPGAGAE